MAVRSSIILALLVGVIVLTAAAPASARSSYYWPSSDKWAFVNSFGKQHVRLGYRYPWAYADCLQRTAQNMYPSYRAFLYAPDYSARRWVTSAGVFRCINLYGDKWEDAYDGYGY